MGSPIRRSLVLFLAVALPSVDLSGPSIYAKVHLRRHQNHGGYCGERIVVPLLLQQIRRVADKLGWRAHELTRQGSHSIEWFSKGARYSGARLRRVYISAGIHGDEPASTRAALDLIQENQWPVGAEVILFPCLNPAGMEQNRREGFEGRDYNRDYRHPKTPLVRRHVEWLSAQSEFDLALLLHEDWEADGFYLYELATVPGDSLANLVIQAVSTVCPILQARTADGWPAEHGIVRPKVDPAERPEWPEALWVHQEKADLCYTFEAPSEYPLEVRAAALVSAVNAALWSLK